MPAVVPGPRAPRAGLRRRLLSLVYEALLLAALLAVAWLFPYVLVGALWGIAAAPWVHWLHLLALSATYFCWLWCHGGQTLAMQTWKLRLVDARTGASVSAARAGLRYALAWPSLLCGALGVLWAWADKDRQFLHDRLAGTKIIDCRDL